jgi:D-tyrosyl-tRNA(Tyr) deacylase
MIGLLQRVGQACVEVDQRVVSRIGPGLLVFVGVERGDDETRAARLLERILGYRVFEDAAGRMNRSLTDTGGELLLVPQFTLAADTSGGTRASFSTAAAPEIGRRLFDHLAGLALAQNPKTARGVFGAHMQVTLTNDGPVTFWVEG